MILSHETISNNLSSSDSNDIPTVTLMLDTVAYQEKPIKGGPEYGKISNRLGKSPANRFPFYFH